jgi:proton glutamate symport protein
VRFRISSAIRRTSGYSVLLALGAAVLGALVGVASVPGTGVAGVDLVGIFGFVGTIFLSLLKMLVIPLVMASIITGVADLGSEGLLGRLGFRTFCYFLLTTLLAALTSLVIANFIHPGLVGGLPVRDLLALKANPNNVAASVTAHAASGLSGLLAEGVPSNVIEAAAGTKILGVVLFSAMFGFFLAGVEDPYRLNVIAFWRGVLRVMTRMTAGIMRLTPIGVFALTAHATASSGIRAAAPLLTFSACVIAGLAIFAGVVLPLLIRVIGRVNPWAVFCAMSPALITAFSTASTSAALPISLECVQKRVGVSERITNFVMPLGISINHAGSALYQCLAALFITEAYGVHLPFSTQFVIVVLALVASMGIGSIPSASLIGLAVILTAMGLPPEALGILLVVDRFLDMARSAVNIFANAACAVIIATQEGELISIRAAILNRGR